MSRKTIETSSHIAKKSKLYLFMDVFINDNPINNKPNPERKWKCIYGFFDCRTG
jgi:hypothetical protein